jgi:thiol-disulfide isomerase/thioredoxin
MNKKSVTILGVYAAIAVVAAGIGVYTFETKLTPAAVAAVSTPVAATSAAASTAASAALASVAPSAKPAAGDPVGALYSQTLPDVSGKDQALAQFKGKALLVNFWAPWCAPCVKEMPELSALQNEAAAKNVQIVGIGIDSPSNIKEFASKLKIAYPVLVAGMTGTDLARTFGNTAGGLPYTVLIGADGKVIKTYLGGLRFDQLRADLAPL